MGAMSCSEPEIFTGCGSPSLTTFGFQELNSTRKYKLAPSAFGQTVSFVRRIENCVSCQFVRARVVTLPWSATRVSSRDRCDG